MIPFQERKKLRKILYSKYSLAVLFLVLIFVARGAWAVHQKAQIAISERNIVQHSLDDLNARTVELNASLERLKSQKGMEQEVRQKYTVARPGEEVVVVVDDTPKKGENSGAAKGEGFWQSVGSFLGF